MYRKYLVILTFSFQMAAILLLLFDLLSAYRDFILHLLMYLFFTYIHKSNNATAIYFLKFMSIFFKSMYSFKLNALTCGPLRLSCVFLANYMSKCQMNSGWRSQNKKRTWTLFIVIFTSFTEAA